MLEIFALPYFGISGVIGWAVFEPFFRVEKTDSLSPAKLAITDLLAISLPVSIIFLGCQWIMPESIESPYVQATVVVIAMLYAASALTLGLFLIPKTIQVTFTERMAVVGVIAPFGIVLTIGWIAILIWASAYSILSLVPASIAIATATAGLRFLGVWICRSDSEPIVQTLKLPIQKLPVQTLPNESVQSDQHRVKQISSL